MCWPARLTTASQAGSPCRTRWSHVIRPDPGVREISVTLSPRARSAVARALPMKPLPPPMSTGRLRSILSSPTPVAAVPGVEEVGEMVVAEAGNLAQDRQTQHSAQPEIARRAPPDFDRAVGADVKPIVRIDAIEAPPDVLDPGAKARQRIRLEIDVTKLDHAGSDRPHEASALALDATVTDGAFRVVPDRELGDGHRALPTKAAGPWSILQRCCDGRSLHALESI